jgi:capsular polysaccharide transport system permease protein
MPNSGQTTLSTLKQKLSGINRLFLVTVVVPTLLAILYFGLIASDVYISESRFIIRSPQKQTITSLGAILQGAGLTRSQDDTYTVHDFILSRDALRKLDRQMKLSQRYGEGDFLSRFPELDMDDSFEALHRYYQKQVSVQLDTLSSISTLRVRAFNADEAHRINQMLLDMGEALINQLNERSRQDMIRYAQAEVDIAEEKARAAALAVSRYRTEKTVFDPERQSALQLQQVSRLQDELIAAKSQLAQVRSLAPKNPQVSVLQRQVGILEAEIQKETAKVAGGERSLSSKAAEYERLALDRSFADKQLATALVSLEQARNEAQRKQLYLDRIVEPGRPDVAVEPRRLRNVAATLALGLVAWGVLSLLIAGVKEHQD